MAARRFRVAFSFSGEKRPYVERVASILATKFAGGAILYDKFHEAEFARARLGRLLPKLYHDNADLIVTVASRDYSLKEWCGLEWDAIFDLIKKRREGEVMLMRFDLVDVDGLFSDAGFVELDQKTPEQAATLILERLALNEGRPKGYYAVDRPSAAPHSTTIPNNLLRLQSFFGREKELEAIRDALDPESRTWGALIDGPGGMGKTSLAVRAAYDCTPEQFDRIIFVSVKDRELDDDGVRTLGTFILPGFIEMLNELARELDRADIPKAPEDQRIRLLLDALRQTKTLLILDNLESLPRPDRDQLFTFVKRLPPGCKAILTSRRRIGSGSELLILEQLDEAAALDTLADLAQHSKLLARTSEAERLALHRQTGGNPLLLRWVAGQLGRGNCRTLSDALQFLRTCPSDNDPLEFVFGDLAQEFTDDETLVLAALTYFTLPAKIEHIAVVAALDRTIVETALRGLANRSLVVPDQEEKNFALVPMVAEFLRKSRPEVVANTSKRLERRAHAFVLENGGDKFERFPLLDAAWPIIAPALSLFLQGPNRELEEVCGNLERFLDFTGRWDESLSISSQAETKALAAGDYLRAGWYAYHAGWVHVLRREAQAILVCAERAAAHWRVGDAGVAEQAAAIRLKGEALDAQGEHSSAIALFRKSLDLFRTLSAQSVDVASSLNALAGSERNSGDFEAAERDFREAHRVAAAIGDAEGVAIYTGNLAELALDREDWLSAEELAREALMLATKVGRQQLIAADSRRLAQALVRQRKSSEALPLARQAVEMLSSLRAPGLSAAKRILSECEAEATRLEAS